MLESRLLKKDEIIHCYDLISNHKLDLIYFLNLGWSKNQFVSQFKKEINFSFGYFKNNNLIGFIIGDLVNIENISEYEILILYVDINYRKKGYATNLIKESIFLLKDKNLKKMYLDVAESNNSAINFYKKINFDIVGKRKKYYVISGNKVDAFILEKIVNF